MTYEQTINQIHVDKQDSKQNKNKILLTDINVFMTNSNSKKENDKFNKKREYIIGCIINNEIPEQYYIESTEWDDLKNEINLYIKILAQKKGIVDVYNVKCDIKGGRKYSYDFDIYINNVEFKVEFKFGASCVNNCPQFSSPMKPSKYLSIEFESWFYCNYFYKIANFGGLKLPSIDIYCKTVHSPDVKCIKEYKYKYDNDIKFNKYCKDIDKEAIKDFIINTADLDTKNLSKYLVETQKDKHYMLYHNGKISYDTVNEDMYKISKVVKKEPTNYICEAENGMKIEIKLRFKNGCGLQYPAFQISRKIPTKKELEKICNKHNINPPKLKNDILSILDENSIIY